MPKGYRIPQIDISNPARLQGLYGGDTASARKISRRRFSARRQTQVVEGRALTRRGCAKFPDDATALAAIASAEYQRARPLRLEHSECDFVVVEGYDGPQPASPAPPSPASKKGYWIGQIDVKDAEGYKPYMIANQAPFGEFGARYLVRGGRQEVVEGRARSRIVAPEFPSYQAALLATIRRVTAPPSRFAKAKATPISSLSRAMTGRSFESGARPSGVKSAP